MKNKRRTAAAAAAICMLLAGCGTNKALPADGTMPISDILPADESTPVSDMTETNSYEPESSLPSEDVTEASEITQSIQTEDSQTPPVTAAERYSEEDDDVVHQADYYEESYVEEENNDSDIVNAITLTFYKRVLDRGDMVMPIVTMYPENAEDKSEIWTSSDYDVAEVDEIGYIYANGPGECIITVRSAANPDVYADVRIIVRGYDDYGNCFDDNGLVEPEKEPEEVTLPENDEPQETAAAVSEPTYINGILIANKSYPLPKDYNPGVDSEAEAAFKEMQADAYELGLNIYIASGFRSYDYQATLYQRYVDRSGKEEADRYSARPGYSEHQTGLAFDLNSIDSSFADTEEYRWVRKNCHKYGFIIRYPEGAEDITGYMYEPWHLRYLGKDTAKEVYNSGLTLEEYLGIDSKYR